MTFFIPGSGGTPHFKLFIISTVELFGAEKETAHMLSLISYYARKWAWLVVLGIIICSSGTFLVSKKMHPVYRASATLIVSLGTSISAYDNLNASVEAAPTYAQLAMSNEVLGPVVDQYRGLTVDQLRTVTTAKQQQSNTPLFEIDVENSNPGVAMQLANEVSYSFTQFANVKLPGTVEILPAQLPTSPVRPQIGLYTAIGALVGLGLALVLIVVFEWIEDRVRNPVEVQELLGGNVLTVLPLLTSVQRSRNALETPAFAEGCRILCARLQAEQKIRSIKLLMVTSPSDSEGKSTVASHLATFLAVTGNHVLLVDATQSALPTQDQNAQLEQHAARASGALEMWAELEEKLNGQPSNVPNLRKLAIGALMASYTGVLPFPWNNRFFDHFRKAKFDYVIFDAPPLLPNAASQLMASSVQAILLVVDASQTPRKVLLSVRDLLSSMFTSAPMIVINKSNWPEWTGHRRQVMDMSYRSADGTEPQMIETPSQDPQNGKADPEATIVLHPT